LKSLKKMLREQEIVVGLSAYHVFSPWLAKVYSDAGSDFVFVEGEHMLTNGADLAGFVLASRLCDMPVVSKCPYVDKGAVCQLLDAGVTGIQLPMTESISQIEDIVSYSKFPPDGVRAACPGLGNSDYEPVDTAQWLRECNEEAVVIAHVESKAGLENIDEILSSPRVDIMFAGILDLCVSLGCPASYDHPDARAAIDRLIVAAHEHGKIAGMWAPSFDVAQTWIARGVRFFETASDHGFIMKGARQLMSQFPGHGPRVKAGGGHF